MTRTNLIPRRGPSRLALGLGAAALALAVANVAAARAAERLNPPQGRFLEIDGVRLHVVERGEGPPLVLLHGNGSMIADLETSGLVDAAARRYRTIVFDRPGFGHSARPRGRRWTPEEQADLIAEALRRMGATGAIVLGHSWGASVAVALALRHPEAVRGVVLASGYYFPTFRPDFALMSLPAVPVLGDALRFTTLPYVGRAIWPLLLRKLFGPRETPPAFAGFPVAMALRPGQLRAAAEESALLVPAAEAAQTSYRSLRQPAAVVVGADDRLIDAEDQSVRLSRLLPDATLRVAAGHGHMVHQTDPETALEAIDDVARRAAA